jgi:hypothetical protein
MVSHVLIYLMASQNFAAILTGLKYNGPSTSTTVLGIVQLAPPYKYHITPFVKDPEGAK